jgi:hypothetical protein
METAADVMGPRPAVPAIAVVTWRPVQEMGLAATAAEVRGPRSAVANPQPHNSQQAARIGGPSPSPQIRRAGCQPTARHDGGPMGMPGVQENQLVLLWRLLSLLRATAFLARPPCWRLGLWCMWEHELHMVHLVHVVRLQLV